MCESLSAPSGSRVDRVAVAVAVGGVALVVVAVHALAVVVAPLVTFVLVVGVPVGAAVLVGVLARVVFDGRVSRAPVSRLVGLPAGGVRPELGSGVAGLLEAGEVPVVERLVEARERGVVG